jgi:hypothetical protein
VLIGGFDPQACCVLNSNDSFAPDGSHSLALSAY